MLEIRELWVRGGDFKIKGVSFSVEMGNCHVLLGPTGSGKTLLLEAIAGLRPAEKGAVIVNSRDITRFLPEKRGIAYLPQDLALFPHLTVEENMAYSLRMKGLGRKERYKRIMPLAKALKIEGLLGRKVHFLSGGEKQRVALARALASGCKVMLLDEPLASLHIAMRREIWRVIKELQNKYELTLLMVTHDLEEALFLADSLSLMSEGRILQSGNKKEVFYYPLTLEAARILGIENYFTALVEEVREDEAKVYVPSLNTQLFIKNRYSVKRGEEIVCAIRGTDMCVVDEEEKEQLNVFTGIIEDIWDKENNIILAVCPLETPFFVLQIEILKNRSCRYHAGQKIKVKLPSEAVIILNKS